MWRKEGGKQEAGGIESQFRFDAELRRQERSSPSLTSFSAIPSHSDMPHSFEHAVKSGVYWRS
jgi:hypothetical protein